jgi:hypothetical protein
MAARRACPIQGAGLSGGRELESGPDFAAASGICGGGVRRRRAKNTRKITPSRKKGKKFAAARPAL